MRLSSEDVMRSIDYPGRFQCGWGPRPESAGEVANRLLELNRRLAAIEPGHGELWPLLAARRIRPGVDPGPILQMCAEDIAKLIDRRARYEAPQLPAPVNDEGYRIDLVALHGYRDERDFGLTLRAGAYADGEERNGLDVKYHPKHRIWRDPELRQLLIVAFVEVLQPDWACAAKRVGRDESYQAWYSPWLVWVAPGSEAPRWMMGRSGPPSATWAAFGGEFRSWPEPMHLTGVPPAMP